MSVQGAVDTHEERSPGTGTPLPIAAAERLLQSLRGVVSARIATAWPTGAVDAIHVLTTEAVTPKQTVRNVESALMAHFGLRVDHRKVSVATTQESARAALVAADAAAGVPRQLHFEDVEVRRSRTHGTTCRVTLHKGDAALVGEAESGAHERPWVELAAHATLAAIGKVERDAGLSLHGVTVVEAFDRQFVLVGVMARIGTERVLLSGTCEVRTSAESASALAVLDATNRWIR